jgi:hypothetical protein
MWPQQLLLLPLAVLLMLTVLPFTPQQLSNSVTSDGQPYTKGTRQQSHHRLGPSFIDVTTGTETGIYRSLIQPFYLFFVFHFFYPYILYQQTWPQTLPASGQRQPPARPTKTQPLVLLHIGTESFESLFLRNGETGNFHCYDHTQDCSSQVSRSDHFLRHVQSCPKKSRRPSDHRNTFPQCVAIPYAQESNSISFNRHNDTPIPLFHCTDNNPDCNFSVFDVVEFQRHVRVCARPPQRRVPSVVGTCPLLSGVASSSSHSQVRPDVLLP